VPLCTSPPPRSDAQPISERVPAVEQNLLRIGILCRALAALQGLDIEEAQRRKQLRDRECVRYGTMLEGAREVELN
jgi:hypothetical protein